MDKVKLGLALLLVVAGVAGFYVLADSPLVVRILAVLAGIALGAAAAWYTQQGQRFFAFSKESVAEAKKVVWPTRKEAMQTTGVVFVLVFVMAAFIWGVDASLAWGVKMLMGWGG